MNHRCKLTFSLAAMLISLTLLVDETPAGVSLNVESLTTTPCTTNYFDVFFGVNSGTPALAGYQIELNLVDQGQGIRLTHLGEPSNAVFPGRIPSQISGRPSLPGSTAAAMDFIMPTTENPLGENPIIDGAGLLRVFFEIDPGVYGTYDVTIDVNPLRTVLSDGSGEELTIDGCVNGTITVVPVPSVSILILSMCFSLFIRPRRI